MIEKKVIHLNLLTIKFPITAITSILHRISGILLFISIGPILWLFQLSLFSQDAFYKITRFLLLNHCYFKFFVWSVLIIFSYHIIFGIRQILMDFGFLNKTIFIGNNSSKIVIAVLILLSIFFGIMIYG